MNRDHGADARTPRPGIGSAARVLHPPALLPPPLLLLRLPDPGAPPRLLGAVACASAGRANPPRSAAPLLPLWAQVVGDKPGAADAAAEQYVGLLLREMRASPRAAEGVGTAPLRSVYFGGGTPSLTPPALLAAILSELRSTHGVEEHAEVTLEMDPGTFDADRLARYIDCGVSRVSLGVQSFDAELLTKAGRAHSLQDVHQALALLE